MLTTVLLAGTAAAKDYRSIKSVQAVSVEVPVGNVPRLPYRLWVEYSDGKGEYRQVKWLNASEATEKAEANPAINPIIEAPTPPPNEVDEKIAQLVVGLIGDRACIQLGIGAMPNAVGQLIARAGLRDLGVHTEMLCDAYVAMAEAGCISGRYKTTDPGKIVYTFAMGTKKLYDFLDGNPDCMLAPVDYTNDPYIIAKNDDMVCLNNAIEVDLYGQVASETSGPRQISGTGGQLDFITAAAHSKNGKGLICLSSTFTDHEGALHSRVVPFLEPGQIVTVPRSYTPIVITEYGIADLRAKTTWERAEELISIAHPDFREGLIRQAEAQGLRIRKIRD